MTKLLIGLGLLTVAGALFGALLTLWCKLFPPAAETVGEEAEEPERRWAVVHCTGGGAGFLRYNYQGLQDCLSASLIPGGGPLSCSYGCLGMGTCVKVCPEGAIQIREGVARVDGERCTACGECVEACPRHIITLEPVKPKRHMTVPCASREGEGTVSDVCTDGCIGCSLCVKACPNEAVSMEGELARIDYEKCDNCGLCAEACPRHLIAVLEVAEPPRPEPPKPPKEPKRPKRIKEAKSFRHLLPQKPVKEERSPEEKTFPEIDIPLDDPVPEELESVEVPVSEKRESAEISASEEPKPMEAPVSEEEQPAVPEESASELPPQKESPEPRPESPMVEEKPTEGTARSSAEAFKAFEQAVAAVDQVLGEQKEADSDHEAEPAGTKTE